MYHVSSGPVGDFLDPAQVAQGTMPRVPQTASMVLPGGLQFSLGPAVPGGAGGFSDLGAEQINWAKWGQDMLSQGIKDTTQFVSGLVGKAGSTTTQQPASTTSAAVPVATQVPQSELLLSTQLPEPSKGLPGWAWALIALGGLGVLGGGAYFLFFRK